jgi:Fe-S cluster assembly protein SufD
MKQATLDERRFANAVAAMPEDALSAARSAAASRFLEVGFPDTRQEDWRYTNLGPAVAVSNDWLGSAPFVAPQPSAQESELTGAVDAHWIAIRNGLVDIGDSQLPDGVSVTRLANDRRAQLGTDDAMSQFNASLLRDGLRIVVTSAATLDKPLGILVADTAAESAAVSQVRIQVQLEAGAAASFVEAHVSRGDGRHFCNAVLEFELARDSEIDYLRIQQRARQHIQIGKLAVRLAERAKFRHGSFDLGGSLIRNDIVAELLGSDSRIELYGLYLAGNQQHVDNHTSVYHRVGPSTSREEYRGLYGFFQFMTLSCCYRQSVGDSA